MTKVKMFEMVEYSVGGNERGEINVQALRKFFNFILEKSVKSFIRDHINLLHLLNTGQVFTTAVVLKIILFLKTSRTHNFNSTTTTVTSTSTESEQV